MIRTHVWATSHTGLVRRRNEDSWAATGIQSSRRDGEIATADLAENSVVAVVADGMGGRPSGDLASRLAVKAVLDAKPLTADDLVDAVYRANDALYDHMNKEPETRGMGTTLAALLIHPDGIAAVNVGDSVVFELIEDRLLQLTIDDVPPGTRTLPGVPSGVITQSLGGSTTPVPIHPRIYQDATTSGRRFLLCTDGLTNFVPLGDITRATSEAPDAAGDAVSNLVEIALEAGGSDNVTVMLLDTDPEGVAPGL